MEHILKMGLENGRAEREKISEGYVRIWDSRYGGEVHGDSDCMAVCREYGDGAAVENRRALKGICRTLHGVGVVHWGQAEVGERSVVG